jgi:putative selenate reductase
MSEHMRPLSFSGLLRWVQTEYRERGSVFGIRKGKFYANRSGRTFTVFGGRAAVPIGPAAGPHTQLAQNILSACLAGGRCIELKTVQTMDGEALRKVIERPCINAVDEGYNVEWSTELTVEEALGEYIKAWFLCHVFTKEFNLADRGDTVFTMSVGYDFEGIRSKKIDAYIEGLKNAANTPAWERCYRYLVGCMGSFERFSQRDLDAIPPLVSPGITLSTLHGCPRNEIEKIAGYLIGEKGLHTFVKCNPTLLGYETARRILDSMGYGYIAFDDHHFREDLQFDEAVDMIGRLLSLAKEKDRSFGVKLTNTFPVQIRHGELPGGEMYMSGRPLFPLSILVAQKLSAAFQGELPISYSGGADFFNLAAILETGIAPVTMATTLLKPGAYERFKQLAELAEQTELERGKPGPARGAHVDVEALTKLAEAAPAMDRYRKEYRGLNKYRGLNGYQSLSWYRGSGLPLFDCATAPCMDRGCPIHQKIPRYLEESAAGNYQAAFGIIAVDNTAPSITGTICGHPCQDRCTRVDYDDPLEIRRAKKMSADHAQESYIKSLRVPDLKTGSSVAVIGAGPAGIAVAVFLRRNGVAVKVYEKREQAYGIVRYVIPTFRITGADIDRDYRIARALGVEFVFGADENYSVKDLKKEHRFVVIASGAWNAGALPLEAGQGIDALRFLEDSKQSGCTLDLGKRVAVIGGGDVAMDCARAAKRNRGVEQVRLVYRRTRELMPAQHGERELARAEGVIFDELLAPRAFQNGVLRCERMRLRVTDDGGHANGGNTDSSGRRGVLGTGETVELRIDTLIGAVGARVDPAPFTRNGIELNAQGYPRTSAANESSLPDLYIAGDCRAGAATVVRAIADGKTIAADILQKLGLPADFEADEPRRAAPPGLTAEREQCLYAKKGLLIPACDADGRRCLSCAEICEICVDLCPNRANMLILIDAGAGRDAEAPVAARQVLHIDQFCNECGNCASFCPQGGRPYRDKFTFFACGEDFADSSNPGFFPTGVDRFRLRLEDKSVIDWTMGTKEVPAVYAGLIRAVMLNHLYLV